MLCHVPEHVQISVNENIFIHNTRFQLLLQKSKEKEFLIRWNSIIKWIMASLPIYVGRNQRQRLSHISSWTGPRHTGPRSSSCQRQCRQVPLSSAVYRTCSSSTHSPRQVPIHLPDLKWSTFWNHWWNECFEWMELIKNACAERPENKRHMAAEWTIIGFCRVPRGPGRPYINYFFFLFWLCLSVCVCYVCYCWFNPFCCVCVCH